MDIDFEKREGRLNLSSAHALVMGHLPKNISFDQVAKKLIESANTELLSFGLFETASPNYSTYYPDVTEEDLNPKDAEFIYPLFRLLSETIVSKGAPIDFSKDGVLKASMKMLLGQTINIDHEVAVGNAVGAVSKVYWQESYKASNGVVVPAGINGTFKIDGKSNPRIARGIMMEPPSIHSNSVTVRFKWEPSHKFENDGEFYNKLGSYDKEGKLVRFIVQEILSYHETSLVSHGADVFAQKIKEDGQIINPGYSKSVYSFKADKTPYIISNIDYKSESLSLSADKPAGEDNSIPNNININNSNNNKQTMDELIKDLAPELGLKVSELTEENIVSKVKEKLEAQKTALTLAEADKTKLTEKLEKRKGKVTDLETQLTEATKNNGLVEKILKDTRDEATRLFKLCKGEKADENILNLIASAGLETAAAFVKDYQEQADKQFAATCKKCGSKEISRSTGLTTRDGIVNNGNEEEGEDDVTDKSTASVLQAMKDKNRKKSRIFSNPEE